MAKKNEDLAALVAAHLAKGGGVTRVEEGAATMDDKAWKRAVRGEATTPTYSDEQRSEIEMEQVREAALVGGQRAAIQTLNDIATAKRRKRANRGGKPNWEAQARYNDEWGVDY